MNRGPQLHNPELTAFLDDVIKRNHGLVPRAAKIVHEHYSVLMCNKRCDKCAFEPSPPVYEHQVIGLARVKRV
jgi:hypothetical protein